jgi:hypothetical protein
VTNPRKSSGRPLVADGSGPATATVVIPATDTGDDGLEWGSRVVSAGFAIDLDPVILVDAMSAALLKHTRDALMAGQRPDGGGAQAPLSARALSDPDRESPPVDSLVASRRELRRSDITSDGRTASCKVSPPPSRNAYIGRERRLGREFLTVRGAAGAAVEAAAREAVGEILTGNAIDKDRDELAAKDAE